MTGPSMVARCPAKVNLSLRVLGRRDDGYHELDTVFQAIDLWDTIEVAPADALTLDCDTSGVPVDDSNLVLRAARSILRHAGKRDAGASIVLRKSIPVQGGLGGGSSDAAGALILMDRFWGLELGRGRLTGLARELGADVPFFLTGGTARGTGRGDLVEPLPFLGELPVLLGCPPFGIPTGDVFRRADVRLTPPRKAVSLPLFSAHKWPGDNDFDLPVNDLEGIVFEGWPELGSFRSALLDAGARMALLSGSGSTVYGLFPGGRDTGSAADLLRGRFPEWTVLETRATEGAAHVVENNVEVGESGRGI